VARQAPPKVWQHDHWLLVPWKGLSNLKLEASHADYKD